MRESHAVNVRQKVGASAPKNRLLQGDISGSIQVHLFWTQLCVCPVLVAHRRDWANVPVVRCTPAVGPTNQTRPPPVPLAAFRFSSGLEGSVGGRTGAGHLVRERACHNDRYFIRSTVYQYPRERTARYRAVPLLTSRRRASNARTASSGTGIQRGRKENKIRWQAQKRALSPVFWERLVLPLPCCRPPVELSCRRV